MVGVSKTELNLTRFYTNPKRLLDLCKDIAKLNQKQLDILKEKIAKLWGKEIFYP